MCMRNENITKKLTWVIAISREMYGKSLYTYTMCIYIDFTLLANTCFYRYSKFRFCAIDKRSHCLHPNAIVQKVYLFRCLNCAERLRLYIYNFYPFILINALGKVQENQSK